jgi:hypothetical protein
MVFADCAAVSWIYLLFTAGHVSSTYVERLKGISLVVRSEADATILLESKVRPKLRGGLCTLLDHDLVLLICIRILFPFDSDSETREKIYQP